ncbi:histone cluster 1, H1b [Chelydra serpentina]|uniref:Histone cluster 1, H1b n=1 Tax=Chelydra serpentina TaxID=8475 RepID=A0A8T1S3B2_CHESE|nr:histone cluster 1, H1b [Chelydra serpentina]
MTINSEKQTNRFARLFSRTPPACPSEIQRRQRRECASLAAIKKTLEGEGYDVRKNKGRIKTVLRYLLSQGALRRVSGSGASGSFRLQRGGVAPKAGKRKTAAAKRRKSSAKTGTAAPGPNDPSGEIKPAAARPKRVSRSPDKISGTVATRRKQILEDIIKGTFLME